MSVSERVPPILSDSSIVSELSAFGIDTAATKKALAASSNQQQEQLGAAQAYQAVLEQILVAVVGFDSEWLLPYHNYTEDLQHSEIYDEAFKKYNLYKAASDYFSFIGVNLTHKEFNEPTTAQVRRTLSTIVNFAKYCAWKEPDVAEAEQEVAAAIQENHSLEERIAVLRQEYEMACNDHEDREMQLEALNLQVEDEEAKLAHLQHDVDSAKEELIQAEKNKTSSERSLLVMKTKHDDALEALREISQKVCEDAEEVMFEYNKQKEKDEKLTQEERSLQQAKNQIQRNFKLLEKAIQDLKEAQKAVDETLEVRTGKKQAKRELQESSQDIKDTHDQLLKAKGARAQMEDAVDEERRKASKEKTSKERELDFLQTRLVRAGKANEAADADAEILRNKTNRVQASIQQTEQELTQIRATFAARDQWLQDTSGQLIADVKAKAERAIADARATADLSRPTNLLGANEEAKAARSADRLRQQADYMQKQLENIDINEWLV